MKAPQNGNKMASGRSGGFALLGALERAAGNRSMVTKVLVSIVALGVLRTVFVGTGARPHSHTYFGEISQRYCNIPDEDVRIPDIMGAEGALSSRMELLGVIMTVRHGDRSAIHTIPGSASDPVFNCSHFPEWPAHVDVASEDTGDLLPGRHQKSATREDGSCTPGQLTPTGITQLRKLGAYIGSAYKALVDTTNVYARSTDYSRTLLSGAAFLATFQPAEASTLRVFEDEDKELMHGVGLRTRSAGSNHFNTKSVGEKVMQGACDRAVRLTTAQIGSFRKPRHLASELAALFGSAAAEKGITDLADAIHTVSCHQQPLPCGHDGCLTPRLATDVLRAADRFYCERFSGEDGGAESARLSMYPFLEKLSSELQWMADGKSKHRVRLYFGHDTVVAPLLSALDAFDCVWPPYASRVVFELWKDKGGETFVCRVCFPPTPLFFTFHFKPGSSHLQRASCNALDPGV